MNGWSSVAAFLWDGGGNARPPAAVAAMHFVPASAFVLAALRGDFATAHDARIFEGRCQALADLGRVPWPACTHDQRQRGPFLSRFVAGSCEGPQPDVQRKSIAERRSGIRKVA